LPFKDSVAILPALKKRSRKQVREVPFFFPDKNVKNGQGPRDRREPNPARAGRQQR